MKEDKIPEEISGNASYRKLHFFWLVDWSGSMEGQKIEKVNFAIKEVIPALRNIEGKERIKIYMRAIRFGSSAEWYIGPEPVALSNFEWKDLSAKGGGTSTSEAIRLLTEALSIENIGTRNVPPVCILLSDGYCTDPPGSYQNAIDKLNQEPWGKKAVRLSIGIGKSDKDFNKEELDAFISPYLRKENNIETLEADKPSKLVKYIITASTAATIASSRSKSFVGNTEAPAPVHIDKGDLSSNNDIVDFSNIDANDVF